ncbi:hypothetical protein FJ967_26945 [Mesorhizobium sp. B2-3-4]|nr:hypothetical protein FJ967_26945 [Mesorhizobium sp. B2-3-4]
MVAIVKSPFSVPEPAPCGLDGDHLAGGDRRRIACDRSNAKDGAGTTFLSREEWRRSGPPCACRVGWEPAGEESRDASLRLRRSRLQPSFGQISPLKRPFGALLGRIGDGDLGAQLRPSRSLRASLASSTHPGTKSRAPPTPGAIGRAAILPPTGRTCLAASTGQRSRPLDEAAPGLPLLDHSHAARLPQPPMMRRLGLRRPGPPASLARV